MADLGDRIRAELDRKYWRASAEQSLAAKRGRAAMLAVVELHPNDRGDCAGCGVDVWENPIPYPCDNVKAIARELEVDE